MQTRFKHCPTCGSDKIKVVRGDFLYKTRGQEVIVPDLEREECPSCGEILFDITAMRKLEAHRPPMHGKIETTPPKRVKTQPRPRRETTPISKTPSKAQAALRLRSGLRDTK